MKMILILSLVFLASCSSKVVVYKDSCESFGENFLECKSAE